MKAIAVFIFICISCQVVSGQEKGRIRFFITPQNAIVKIDGKPIKQMGGIELVDEGQHILEICASRMAPFQDTIEIFKDSTITYRKRLSKSTEYLAYEDEYKKYRKARISEVAQKTTILAVSASLTAAFLSIMPRRNKSEIESYKVAAENSRERYNSSYSQAAMEDAQQQFESFRTKYEQAVEDTKKKAQGLSFMDDPKPSNNIRIVRTLLDQSKKSRTKA